MKLDRLAADRLLQAIDLHAAGVVMMRENLRRRMPKATPAQLEKALSNWLAVHAPVLDKDFAPGRWPRRQRR